MTKVEIVQVLLQDAEQDVAYHLEKLNEARYKTELYEKELTSLRK